MKNLEIPLFKEINEHYAAVGVKVRTKNPLFHIAKLGDMESDAMNVMHPYRNDFYEIIFGKNVKELSYSINGIKFDAKPRFILFSAPNQVHSWEKKENWEGFTLCFKADFLKQYLTPTITEEFPFFEINEANFLSLSVEEAKDFETYFDLIEAEQKNNQNRNQELIKANMLAILFLAKRRYEKSVKFHKTNKRGYALIAEYQRLINKHFVAYHKVSDYAKLMNKSANYLTQVIIELSGKSAKSFITNRIILEAKYYLCHTQMDISEVSYRLNFGSPAHFGQFFKKEVHLSPSEFRIKNNP